MGSKCLTLVMEENVQKVEFEKSKSIWRSLLLLKLFPLLHPIQGLTSIPFFILLFMYAYYFIIGNIIYTVTM